MSYTNDTLHFCNTAGEQRELLDIPASSGVVIAQHRGGGAAELGIASAAAAQLMRGDGTGLNVVPASMLGAHRHNVADINSVDTTPTGGSLNLITSGGVHTTVPKKVWEGNLEIATSSYSPSSLNFSNHEISCYACCIVVRIVDTWLAYSNYTMFVNPFIGQKTSSVFAYACSLDGTLSYPVSVVAEIVSSDMPYVTQIKFHCSKSDSRSALAIKSISVINQI